MIDLPRRLRNYAEAEDLMHDERQDLLKAAALLAEHEALLRRVAEAEVDAERWRWYQNECVVCLDEIESDEREAYADAEIANRILAEPGEVG